MPTFAVSVTDWPVMIGFVEAVTPVVVVAFVSVKSTHQPPPKLPVSAPASSTMYKRQTPFGLTELGNAVASVCVP